MCSVSMLQRGIVFRGDAWKHRVSQESQSCPCRAEAQRRMDGLFKTLYRTHGQFTSLDPDARDEESGADMRSQ